MKNFIPAIIFFSCLYLCAQKVPAVYLFDTFPEAMAMGPAVPFMFNSSSVLRFNGSALSFIDENDFSLAYKFTPDPRDFSAGLSFSRSLTASLTAAGLFSYRSAQHGSGLYRPGDYDSIEGYETFLLSPQASYRINKIMSAGVDTELLFRNLETGNRYFFNFGFSASWHYKIFSAGIALKNILSLFAEWDAPYIMASSCAFDLFRRHLAVSFGFFWRENDNVFAAGAGITARIAKTAEIYTGYNNRSLSLGCTLKYKVLRLTYAAASPVQNGIFSGNTGNLEYYAGINIFYQTSMINPARAEAQMGSIGRLMQKAQTELEGGNYSAAIDLYQSILKIDRNHLEARDKLQEAKKNLQRHKMDLMAKGEEHYRKKEYLEAAAAFREVLRYDPANAQVRNYLKLIEMASAEQISQHYLYAELHFKKEEYTNALSEINSALLFQPDNGKFLKFRDKSEAALLEQQKKNEIIALGMDLIEKGKKELAGNNFDQAIILFQNSMQYLADKTIAAGHISQAEEMKKNFILYSQADIFFQKGRSEFISGNFASAEELYRKALGVYSGHREAADALLNIETAKKNAIAEGIRRGREAYDRDNFQAAEKEWKTVLGMDNQNVQARLYLAELYRSRNSRFNACMRMGSDFFSNRQYAPAYEQFSKALLVIPESQTARAALAKTDIAVNREYEIQKENGDRLLAGRKYKDAMTCYSAMLELKPGDAYAEEKISLLKTRVKLREEFSKAETLFMNRDFGKALEILERIAEAEPAFTQAAQLLVLCRAEAEKTQQQDKLIGMFETGVNHFKRKKYAEAVNIWNELLKTDPENELVKDYIKIAGERELEMSDLDSREAQAAMERKDWKSARALLETVLAAAPQNEQARSRLTEVNLQIEKHTADLENSARSLMASGQYAKAEKTWQDILAFNTNNSRILDFRLNAQFAAESLEAAKNAEKNGKLADAFGYYRDLLSAHPESAEAMKKISSISQSMKKNKSQSISEGDEYYRQGDYDRAIIRWEMAAQSTAGQEKTEIEKKMSEARSRRKKLSADYEQQAKKAAAAGDYQSAVNWYARLVKIEPLNQPAREGLEQARYKIQAQAANAEKNRNAEIIALFSRGIEHYKAGELEKAIVSWEKVLQLDP
ncbi:MAG TPA: hypothetical protein DC049_12545, partial [Spirochaetia bacterium]|nr:hypothetical protein [Spirochaetia bacterium]